MIYNCFKCKAVCCKQVVVWLEKGEFIEFKSKFLIYKKDLSMNIVWYLLYGIKLSVDRERDMAVLMIPNCRYKRVSFKDRRGYAFNLKCKKLKNNRCSINDRKPKVCKLADCPLKISEYSHISFSKDQLNQLRSAVLL